MKLQKYKNYNNNSMEIDFKITRSIAQSSVCIPTQTGQRVYILHYSYVN